MNIVHVIVIVETNFEFGPLIKLKSPTLNP